MPRPNITKIILEINGTRNIEIDPIDTAALFFNDFAVNDILVQYYNSIGDTTKANQAVNDWNTGSTDTGTLPVAIEKRPNCTYITID